MTKSRARLIGTMLLIPAVGLSAACRGRGGQQGGGAGQQAVITADGSSTVYPITEAVAEEFQAANRGTRVTVGTSGTGGGFQKFCRNEMDISNASRPIKQTERDACASAGVDFIELPIAYDGLSVVVNPRNTWVTSMTVSELKRLWEPAAQGKITRWNHIRSDWPDHEIHLFGAGVDSGTFDYFTEAIVGKGGQSRGDYTSSEDDNVIVQGVSGDVNALGYFGYAYYEQNKDKLKVVPIDDGDASNGSGAVAPSPETVANGTYRPLSRPVFIYVKTKALDRPEVKAFVEFFLEKGPALAREVGYIPLPPKEQELVRARYTSRRTGTMFAGAEDDARLTLEQRLSR